jgi:hypothetical protein
MQPESHISNTAQVIEITAACISLSVVGLWLLFIMKQATKHANLNQV